MSFRRSAPVLSLAIVALLAQGTSALAQAQEARLAGTVRDATGAAVLTTADTSIGEVVVDADGMTAYYFLNDTPGSGTSACTGDCLTAWPPILAESPDVVVDGITADVGTIETPDGEHQVTVDGRPVYLFAQDDAPGDVNGQGVNDVWYAVAPDGSQVGP